MSGSYLPIYSFLEFIIYTKDESYDVNLDHFFWYYFEYKPEQLNIIVIWACNKNKIEILDYLINLGYQTDLTSFPFEQEITEVKCCLDKLSQNKNEDIITRYSHSTSGVFGDRNIIKTRDNETYKKMIKYNLYINKYINTATDNNDVKSNE